MGEPISVINVGSHNQFSGPDFFNAKMEIGGQVWAGNVEIHSKASDWYSHNHQKDENYDSVILHVVWEDDIEIFRKDRSVIPTLQLKDYINHVLLEKYQNLFDQRTDRFINCESEISSIPVFAIDNWLERLYFERLENKSRVILKLLEQSNNDWEKVLFIMMLKSFGSKINGDLFYEIGTSLDFKIIRHFNNKELELEALLFGRAGLLKTEDLVDPYYEAQKKQYEYFIKKFSLDSVIGNKAAFFKLRPLNFPTIRLSQLARLYAESNNLFQSMMSANVDGLYKLLKVPTNCYWETHYTFGKQSKSLIKNTSKRFIDLLIINTILPIKFCYLKYKGEPMNDAILKTIVQLSSEKNSVIKKYRNLGVSVSNAMDSQSLLQLYDNYCVENKCLQCAIGATLLK